MENTFDIHDLAGRYSPDARGHVLPPRPFPYPKGVDAHPIGAQKEDGFDGTGIIPESGADETRTTIFGTPMYFPLSMRSASVNDNEWWLLPTEPLISISAGNILVRRNVAKSKLRGSIKERWSTDDYAITIDGLLTKKDDWSYPESDVAMLRAFCETREPVDVLCPLFEHFGITRMVIEKCDFPFTKGPENQSYRIGAFSDDAWVLFIEPTQP